MKINMDSVSAVKITENEGRVNAQINDTSHVSQSVASQKLPDRLSVRDRRTRRLIRATPHMLAIRMPTAFTRRAEARACLPVLPRFACTHEEDIVLSPVPDTTHLPRRRTLCLVNCVPRRSVSQPLVALLQVRDDSASSECTDVSRIDSITGHVGKA